VAQTLRSLETSETVSYIAPAPGAGWRPQRRRLALSTAGVLAAGCLAVGIFLAVRPGPENGSPKPGKIVLEDLPADAEVMVDGTKVAATLRDGGKLAVIQAAPGKHTLVFKSHGLSYEAQEVTLAPGEERQVAVRLAPAGPIAQNHAYEGSVDILVWRKDEAQARKLRLTDPGALPLAPGDQIRVTARIKPAAYLYLFWIDEEGKAAPVYPWKPGEWGTRTLTEAPVEALDLPEQGHQGWKITAGREGMESLILLARDAPFAANDEELQRHLDGLPAQQPVQNIHAAVWFENGKVVENDPPRKRLDFTVSNINDPVLRLQERLSQKLQPLARYSAAVSFARQGKN
jgi:hypothetical protein